MSDVNVGRANYFIDGTVNLLSSLARFAVEPGGTFASAISSLNNNTSAGNSAAATSGIEDRYLTLMQEQMHQQEQLQLVTLVSNSEKSKHESSMTPLRNIRVG